MHKIVHSYIIINKLLSYTRKHWQIESFHWLLDMNYNEDGSRVSNVNSQKCLNVIRKYCISIIKKYIENHYIIFL